MLEIIKERSRETVTEHYIEFYYKNDPEAGYCFPANKDRTLARDKLTPVAIANYENCLVDNRLTKAEFTTYTRTYAEPAIGKCSCGAEVVLDSGYLGAVRCSCGRWYNVFGQELRDPKYWEEY